jgi:hypothetical protein
VAIRDPALFRTFVQKINAASEVAKKDSKPISTTKDKPETAVKPLTK